MKQVLPGFVEIRDKGAVYQIELKRIADVRSSYSKETRISLRGPHTMVIVGLPYNKVIEIINKAKTKENSNICQNKTN